MRILMSNEAHQDIDSIFEYISRDSIKYANETSENIYSCISNLENYRIVYDFSEDSNTIYIHFVVHSKRNFKSFYKSYIKNNF